MDSPRTADPPDSLRHFFFQYAISVNALARKPRWYHGVTRNCTTALYAQARGFGDYLRAHLPGYAATNVVATTQKPPAPPVDSPTIRTDPRSLARPCCRPWPPEWRWPREVTTEGG